MRKKERDRIDKPSSDRLKSEREKCPHNDRKAVAETDDYGFSEFYRNPERKTNTRKVSKKQVSGVAEIKQRNHMLQDSTHKHQYGTSSLTSTSSPHGKNMTDEESEFKFYTQHVKERPSRSTTRCQKVQNSDMKFAKDRSRSKSKDIITLYTTNNPRSRSTTPAKSHQSYDFRGSESSFTDPVSVTSTPVKLLKSYDYIPDYTKDYRRESLHCAKIQSSDSQKTLSLKGSSRSSTPAQLVSFSQSEREKPHQHTQMTVTETNSYTRSSQFYFPYSSRRGFSRNDHDSVTTPLSARSSRSTTPAYSNSKTRSRSLASYNNLESPNYIVPQRARSECREAISLSSNVSLESRAVSSSEIASQNLEDWMATNSKRQQSSTGKISTENGNDNGKFVTLLEMDPSKNQLLENSLNQANSMKPANIRMMMIAGYLPSNDWASSDEIEVKAGAIVTGRYKQNEWVFVTTGDGQQGFVPFAFTKPIKVTSMDEFDKPGANPSAHVDKNLNKPSTSNIKHEATITRNKNKLFQKSYLKLEQRTAMQVGKLPHIKGRRESLTSLCSSVFVDDFPPQYSLENSKASRRMASHADCMVVDTESDRFNHLDYHAYCSDSGISEPNSNHSEEHFSDSKTPRSITVADNIRNSMKFNICQMPLGPLGEHLSRKQSPSSLDSLHWNIPNDMYERAASSKQTPAQLKPDIPKDYNGPRVKVIYPYQANHEDDVTVQSGEILTILNGEDVEWIWVQMRNGTEGFMPRAYVSPLDASHCQKFSHRHLIVAL